MSRSSSLIVCDSSAVAQVDLSAGKDVEGFFRGALLEALRHSQLETSPEVEVYLSGLLADFARPDARPSRLFDRPLTLLVDEALQLAGPERFERLRALGDSVLYTSGFFADHLERRGVELGYVNVLGARAYSGAARTLGRSALLSGSEELGATDLFSELAAGFPTFVRVLRHVADRFAAGAADGSEQAVIALYERWLKTRSVAVARALSERGINPVSGRRSTKGPPS